jgi:hypothetical protein
MPRIPKRSPIRLRPSSGVIRVRLIVTTPDVDKSRPIRLTINEMDAYAMSIRIEQFDIDVTEAKSLYDQLSSVICRTDTTPTDF